jgi:hypothetical protein
MHIILLPVGVSYFEVIYLLSVIGSLVALTMWKQVFQSTDALVSACVIVLLLLVTSLSVLFNDIAN